MLLWAAQYVAPATGTKKASKMFASLRNGAENNTEGIANLLAHTYKIYFFSFWSCGAMLVCVTNKQKEG